VQAFNFICYSCGNQLLETGILLSSSGQCPFVCCETCRTLYYIDVLENAAGQAVIVVEPTRLEPEQEFDIIRNAEKRTPLREYLEKAEKSDDKNVNPHFKQQELRASSGEKDLKIIIENAVTPSDVIRGLNE
jgi:hypothetical protein